MLEHIKRNILPNAEYAKKIKLLDKDALEKEEEHWHYLAVEVPNEYNHERFMIVRKEIDRRGSFKLKHAKEKF